MDPPIIAAIVTIIVAAITIIASMYGMLRFMLRDIHKDMLNFEKRQDKFDTELKHINNRLDGLYRVILDRTYGKNIPEELK
jgi:hypothetical protein